MNEAANEAKSVEESLLLEDGKTASELALISKRDSLEPDSAQVDTEVEHWSILIQSQKVISDLRRISKALQAHLLPF